MPSPTSCMLWLLIRLNRFKVESIGSSKWLVVFLKSWTSTGAYVRATSHTSLRAHGHYTSSTLIGGKGGAGLSLVHTTHEGHQSMWMQDGCKVYMASNRSGSIVTGTIFKNLLLEVGLTQNQEITHSKRLQLLFYSNLSCVKTRMNWRSLK